MNNRVKRHYKIRKKIDGTDTRPRLSVFRSSKHISAQIIDDNVSRTIAAASDFNITGKKMERAFEVGKKLAQLAGKRKIKEVVFDRGGFLYHGRVKSLAEGARVGGLKF